MMKKTAKTGIALILSLSLLSACSKEPAATGTGDAAKGTEKVKLSLWHNFTGEDARAKTMRAIIEEYKKANPNVDLEVQAIPPDGYKTRLKTVAAANEMPDLFQMWPGAMTKEFVSGNLLQPVGDLLDKNPEWKNGFLPNSFDDFTVDGKVYSIPMSLSPTSILYYNKKIFDDNGVTVPKTWDEMMKAVETFKSKKITPIALGNKAAWLAQSSILSSLADRYTGTEWFMKAAAQDGAKFTDPEFVAALKALQDLGKAGAFQEGFNSIDNTQMEQMFAQGKAAMMIDGGWALTNLTNGAQPEALNNIEVTVLPSVPNGKGDPQSLSGVVGIGLGLNKKVEGAKKEAADKLIQAMAGPEAQKRTLESNQLVAYKVELDKSKVSTLFAKVNDLVGQVKRTPVYDSQLSSAASEVINNGIQELLMGGKPEDVAKKLQDAQAKSLGK